MRKTRSAVTAWRVRSIVPAFVLAFMSWASGGPPQAMAAPPVFQAKVDRIIIANGSSGRHAAVAAGSDVRSLLNVRSQMNYGQFVWNDAGVAKGPTWVRVDLGRQIISVFRAGHEIGTSVILYGTPGKPTPTGQFKILMKRKDHRSSLYDAEMPFTLRLTHDGISIHGSNVRPRAGTHGCVGVPLKFAELMFNEARVGGRVVIVG